MKRKYADYPNWKRAEEKEYINKYFDNDDFKGNAGILYCKKVKEKLFVERNGKDYLLIDSGYKWLQFFPKDDKTWALSIALTDKNKVREWYFDVTKDNGLTEEGIPYIDDLYLDVVITPDGEIELLDEDELQEALDTNDITKEDFDMAYKVAKKIMKEWEGKIPELTEFANKYVRLIEE